VIQPIGQSMGVTVSQLSCFAGDYSVCHCLSIARSKKLAPNRQAV